ncbi:MAG TPA: phenylacetate--CoA ligase, partial [Burkholderiales bacterium]
MNAMLQPRYAAKLNHRPRPARPYYYEREAETLPREALVRLQLARLRAMLKNAWQNVPLHRARMDAARVRPQDVRTLDDLAALPFTVKADLREHYPFGLFARPREALARLHASSGTTGKPTVVGYTSKDLATWSHLMARSLACAGARPGDVVHNAYGYGLFTGGLGAHYGAERLGATVVPMS